MITLTAKLKAKEGQAEALQAALRQMIAEVQAKEPGVIQYAMHSVDGQPGAFLFYEQYADDAAFAAHRTTDHMKAFASTLGELMEGRMEPTRLTFIDGVKR
jgi:quinol monooxygenase YgiN